MQTIAQVPGPTRHPAASSHLSEPDRRGHGADRRALVSSDVEDYRDAKPGPGMKSMLRRSRIAP
jgi:hypothetical protein